jgi:hypothetical protein
MAPRSTSTSRECSARAAVAMKRPTRPRTVVAPAHYLVMVPVLRSGLLFVLDGSAHNLRPRSMLRLHAPGGEPCRSRATG